MAIFLNFSNAMCRVLGDYHRPTDAEGKGEAKQTIETNDSRVSWQIHTVRIFSKKRWGGLKKGTYLVVCIEAYSHYCMMFSFPKKFTYDQFMKEFFHMWDLHSYKSVHVAGYTQSDNDAGAFLHGFDEYTENTRIHCYNNVSELLGWSAVDCITCLSKLRKNLRIRKLSNANLWDACSTINNLPRKVPDENDVVKPFNAIIRWREESLYRFGHILWLGRNQPGKGFECPYPQPRLKGVE